MTHSGPEAESNTEAARKSDIARWLDRVGWGLFFIWVGIAVLADVGWGIGLLGVGILALGEQWARKHYGLEIEAFWLIVGLLLVGLGGWELIETHLWLVAIVLIIAGIALVVSAVRGKPRDDSSGADAPGL
jgi:hypothetical protein